MNVNGVTTPPVVYIPTQVIAPMVPNDHPIGLPTADRKADPTPQGSPFVGADVGRKAGDQTGQRAAKTTTSAFVEHAHVSAPVRATPEPKAVTAAPAAAPAAAKRGAFDRYA